ncbi:hypothetical protein AB0E08_11015 [Streptomyces sp. NPDC048281]|uniref:hypothetical protein n=1 Tax=Streptomyces sp. NPDC048281 TaxID=3154715 RepID=UPI00341AA159
MSAGEQYSSASSEARDLWALLSVVLEAVTLPYDAYDYDERIRERAGEAKSAVRDAINQGPDRLGWHTDWLRHRLTAEQADAQAREKNRCRRCRTPFDPADGRFDGNARHRETPWCRGCVDNCHEGGAEHVCKICDPARYGGEPR